MPADHSGCAVLCLTKVFLFLMIALFVLYLPLDDPKILCQVQNAPRNGILYMCKIYDFILNAAERTIQAVDMLTCMAIDALYEGKLLIYSALSSYDRNDYCRIGRCFEDGIVETPATTAMQQVTNGEEMGKEEVDRVIEDELTEKLCNDLLQSIERKFQVDLERSVDMVLVKIKLLLQNGTMHIQDRLLEIQNALENMKKTSETELETCIGARQNETAALAEKALHQMVVCGYALIGHDPAQAVREVVTLKTMITTGLKPLHNQRNEVLSLLKVCGHDHDSLKKVIKCVIAKSPVIKTAMMAITGQLIEGVVSLTKLMAHGAMHEACLIEVIKTTEDEAFQLLKKVSNCIHGNTTEKVENYIKENNATVLDINLKELKKIIKEKDNGKDNKDIKEIIRRMLSEDNNEELDEGIKKKLLKLKGEFEAPNQDDVVVNEIK